MNPTATDTSGWFERFLRLGAPMTRLFLTRSDAALNPVPTPPPNSNAPQPVVFSGDLADQLIARHRLPAAGHGLTREQIDLMAAEAELQERFAGSYVVWVDQVGSDERLLRRVIDSGGDAEFEALSASADQVAVDGHGSVFFEYIDED